MLTRREMVQKQESDIAALREEKAELLALLSATIEVRRLDPASLCLAELRKKHQALTKSKMRR